jgi:hypothetical protein
LQILRLVRGRFWKSLPHVWRTIYFEDGAPRLLAGDCCPVA